MLDRRLYQNATDAQKAHWSDLAGKLLRWRLVDAAFKRVKARLSTS